MGPTLTIVLMMAAVVSAMALSPYVGLIVLIILLGIYFLVPISAVGKVPVNAVNNAVNNAGNNVVEPVADQPAIDEPAADEPAAGRRSMFDPTAIRSMGQPLLESEPFDDPTEVDRRVKEEWFPGPDSHIDRQQKDMMAHKRMRRNQEWSSTRLWTKEDKEKYEQARRRRERDIALALKPDPFMIIEAGPEDARAPNRAPFLDIYSDTHLWHRQTFQHGMRGTGQLSKALTSTDLAVPGEIIPRQSPFSSNDFEPVTDDTAFDTANDTTNDDYNDDNNEPEDFSN